MSNTENVVEIAKVESKNDPAFGIVQINTTNGETTVVLQKGILGILANQLKTTNNAMKGSSIIRKLGYVLSECGDVQYGADISKTSLDPECLTKD